MQLHENLRQRLLSNIDRDDIVRMSREVISIPSPTGEELEMGRYMRAVFQDMGLQVGWSEVEEGRPNVVGLLEGQGGGRSLMFNGHMDTSYTGREEHLTGIGYKPHPVVQEGVVYGLGIYNMKGALVCYVHALKAVRASGIPLAGDVYIAAVVGEIEKSQWGEAFSGRQYRGYGAGTHRLVNQGVVPDMCILGEPTDLKLVLGHYGSMWARISTTGPFMHTGFSTGRQPENAIRRMHRVTDSVLEWAGEWEEKAAYGNKQGLVNLGCIQAGQPWRVSRLPHRCDLFLDVRVPPSMPMADARREFQKLVGSLRAAHPDWGIESEIFVTCPGAEIRPDHEMVRAIDSSHREVLGRAPERDTVLWCSDASVMTRYGIETVNYGPSAGVRRADGEKLPIQTMVDITGIYALTIARLCGAKG